MSDIEQLNDLDLAALVASKICHDALGPMTAIGFGLEMLDEGEDDEEQRESAMSMIKKGVWGITAKLQFARLAFGAGGSAGFQIDLGEAEKLARDYVEGDKKHKIEWTSSQDALPKDYVKLLLNLVVVAVGTVPRGGKIAITISGDKDKPQFLMHMSGPKARVPEGIQDLLDCIPKEEIVARSIQPYYAGRIAKNTGTSIKMKMIGEDVELVAS
jgi:histidine phosphotransferase ChpT